MDQSTNPSDSLANPSEFKDVIELVSREALVYLEGLDPPDAQPGLGYRCR